MEIWLSYDNKKEMHQIPVLPERFEIESSNLNTVVNINEIGNILLIGKKDLKKISIESFFPDQDYPFVTTRKRHDPYVYIESIERWKQSNKPIRLVITKTPINMAVGIENFTYGQKDGTKDIYYKLDLVEYIFTNIKESSYKEEIREEKNEENIRTREETKEIQKIYIVKKGDTLTAIAKKITGDSKNYKIIAEKNNIKDPNKIKEGIKLQI